MVGEICITPWWLRLIGRPPFRQHHDDYGGEYWVYLSFADAVRLQKDQTNAVE